MSRRDDDNPYAAPSTDDLSLPQWWRNRTIPVRSEMLNDDEQLRYEHRRIEGWMGFFCLASLAALWFGGFCVSMATVDQLELPGDRLVLWANVPCFCVVGVLAIGWRMRIRWAVYLIGGLSLIVAIACVAMLAVPPDRAIAIPVGLVILGSPGLMLLISLHLPRGRSLFSREMRACRRRTRYIQALSPALLFALKKIPPERLDQLDRECAWSVVPVPCDHLNEVERMRYEGIETEQGLKAWGWLVCFFLALPCGGLGLLLAAESEFAEEAYLLARLGGVVLLCAMEAVLLSMQKGRWMCWAALAVGIALCAVILLFIGRHPALLVIVGLMELIAVAPVIMLLCPEAGRAFSREYHDCKKATPHVVGRTGPYAHIAMKDLPEERRELLETLPEIA